MTKWKLRVRLPMPLWFMAVLALLLVLAWFVQYEWMPGGMHFVDVTANANLVDELAPVSAIRINEVMTSNRTAWAGVNGRYPDWVELINAGNQPFDITGWKLTDRLGRSEMFTFEDRVLAPGELTLVYMTGVLDAPDGGDQAPFKLSSAGDALMLFDAHGSIMESINLPALGPNQVYARDVSNGDWRITDEYTPGLQNSQDNFHLLTQRGATSESPIVISELMAENRATLRDADGDYSDWIELHNEGTQPVSLLSYCLSDDPDRPQQYRLPDVTLAPGAYLVVFASGKDRQSPDAELHANFKLNAEGETVALTDPSGQRVGAVLYELLRADQSYARGADGTYAKGTPSPGRPNP